jgi:hypothetical protein
MIIEIDMDEPDYLSSLCMGDPFAYIDTLEDTHVWNFITSEGIEDVLY